MATTETTARPAYKTKANKRKLLNTLEYIKTHRKEWDQDVWVDDRRTEFCKTRFCFAGFAIHRSKDFKFWRNPYGKRLTDIVVKRGAIDNIDSISAREAGKTILGLNDQEADALFEGTNNLRDLNTAVRHILNNKYPPYDWEDHGYDI